MELEEIRKQAKMLFFDNGLCYQCWGKRKVAEGFVKCQHCLDSINKAKVKLRQERRAKGFCVDCGVRPPLEGIQRCAECRQYFVNHRKNYKK